MGRRKGIAEGLTCLGLSFVLALGLAGCGIDSEALDELAGRLRGENFWEELREEPRDGEETRDEEETDGRAGEKSGSEKPFGGAPYFRDDGGRNTQREDGWIYGYWSRKLCRLRRDTLEEEVLFETAKPQSGLFCMEGEWIYFLEETGTEGGEIEVSLCRVRRDGSDFSRLDSDLALAGWGDYQLDCYEGMLYLTSGDPQPKNYYFHPKNYYFRLEGDGAVSRAAEGETLYGRLPEGFFACDGSFEFDALPRMPYCMRNYGYVFVRDKDGELYRMDPGTGEAEHIAFAEEIRRYTMLLTNDSLVYRDGENVWYRRSLDDLSELDRLGYWDCNSADFYDEKGLYRVTRSEDGELSVDLLSWSGEARTLRELCGVKRLRSALCGDGFRLEYYDGEFLYFDAAKCGDGAVMRLPVAPGADGGGQVTLYFEDPVKEICSRETDRLVFEAEDTQGQGELVFARVIMTEGTPAAEKINALLWEEKYVMEDETESCRRAVRREAGEEWAEYRKSRHGYAPRDLFLIRTDIYSDVSYLDQRYIGVRVDVSTRYFYDTNAMCETVNFLFDRATGERLSITDVVTDSRGSIEGLFLPLIQEKNTWTDWEEERMRASVFEEDRLFLTPEGVGLHYNVLELGSSSEGSSDLVVPWEKFNRR